MANQMNQIIIEGKIAGKAESKGNTSCFTAENFHKGQKSVFVVELDETMRGLLLDKCKEGRTVRIVGYLKTADSGAAVIAAEHMEFKAEGK